MLVEEEELFIQKDPLEIIIEPLMTFKELKLKAFMDYNIPVDLQRWLINDKLLNDDDNLFDYGITDESVGHNLYINNQSNQEDQQINVKFKITKIASETESFQNKITTHTENSKNTIEIDNINSEDDLLNEAAALPVPDTIIIPELLPHDLLNEAEALPCPDPGPDTIIIPELVPHDLLNAAEALPCACPDTIIIPELLAHDVLNEAAALPGPDTIIIPELVPHDVFNEAAALPGPDTIIVAELLPHDVLNEAAGLPGPDAIIIPELLLPQQEIELENSTWICSFCTFINPPLTLACSICYHEKPLSVEDEFIISEELKNFLYDENEICNELDVNNIVNRIIKPTTAETLTVTSSVTSTEPASPKISHYFQILNLDTTNIVHNSKSFDCPICFINVEVGEGCVLHDCLHTFCRDCLASTIQYSEDAEIKCPYANEDYSCDSFLQDREIRSLVTQEIYDKHLANSVRYAEHKIQNSFHCKTPNCQGWCINEDNVYEFQCPVCEYKNCLICKVIHNGITCAEYHDELNRNGEVKVEAQRTNEMIDNMVNNGKVMNCPTCKVILEKISGCDWLQCTICKTEVCWATRKPRRGPNGCNCGVNGKCHPNCNNCH